MALCSGLQILCFFLSQVTLGMTSEITQSHLPCHRETVVFPRGVTSWVWVWGACSECMELSPLYSSGCCYSIAKSCLTLHDLIDQSPPGSPVLHYVSQFAQTHIHWAGDAIQPFHTLSSPSPAFSLSQHQGLFQWVSSSHQYWSFSFSISPSNEYSGLISFRMDWLDLLAVQGTLKSFLQHHSSKASILQHSTFLWSNSHIHTWLLEKP